MIDIMMFSSINCSVAIIVIEIVVIITIINNNDNNVTPIHKNMCLDDNDLNNYRPVCNLCFIAKILEKLVLSQFASYLMSQSLQYLSISISSLSQHGNSSSESC